MQVLDQLMHNLRKISVSSQGSSGQARRGSAIVEFALVFMTCLVVMLTIFQLAFTLFVHGVLTHAVREGVRFAITGTLQTGLGHDDSIKRVVKDYSLGLLNGQDDKINIQYYAADGCATSQNSARNTVVLSVQDYEMPLFAGYFLGPSTPDHLNLTVRAVDKLEPFPNRPPRTLSP